MNLYGLLKLLHVLSVVVWIGGVMALWTVTLRLARDGGRARLAELLPMVTLYGQRVAGPASIVVLITGIAMVFVARLGGPVWVELGMVGILLHFLLGATIVRRSWAALSRAASEPGDETHFAAAMRRATTVSWIYLLLMASVIAVMVLKPA